MCSAGTGDGADHRRKGTRRLSPTSSACEQVDPDFPFADLFLARALTFAGRLPEACAAVGNVESRDNAAFLDGPCLCHGRPAGGGGKDRGCELITLTLAIIYAALGEDDRALLVLDRAADLLPQRVWAPMMYPEMASLRGDARFAAIRRKLGLP